MKRHDAPPCFVALACVTILFCTGCPVMLPGDFLSSMALNPDTSCDEVARQLNLGALRPLATPGDAGLSFSSISIVSANGAKLSGWFIPAQRQGVLDANPLGTVLVTHGTDGSIACAIPWGAVAALNRFHAVLFDYQGFGDSEGTANIATLLDDSEAVLNWIVANPSVAQQKVHLLGVSLGTGPAFGLAALRNRPQIQSVMVNGAFDPQQELEAITSSVALLFPFAGISARSEFSWLFDMRAGMGNIQVPAMFITAELDGITPASGADAMRKLLPSPPMNSWLFTGMTHVQPLFKLTDNYVSVAVTFWRNPNGLTDPEATITDSSIQVPPLKP